MAAKKVGAERLETEGAAAAAAAGAAAAGAASLVSQRSIPEAKVRSLSAAFPPTLPVWATLATTLGTTRQARGSVKVGELNRRPGFEISQPFKIQHASCASCKMGETPPHAWVSLL